MECVVREDTDSLITYDSEEEDQDADGSTAVVPYGLQDVSPNTTGPIVPMGTQYGEIDLNNSNENHIGPKYIATNITIVNPPETRIEASEPVIISQKRCSRLGPCIVVMVLLILISISLLIWYVKVYTKDSNNDIVNITRLVGRDEWGANPLFVNYNYKYLSFIDTIITITQTNMTSCDTLKSCSEIVRELQTRDIKIMKDIDIKYNFLIGGDGNIYEGRGWNGTCYKPNSNSTVVRVGFIGDYNIYAYNFLSYSQVDAFNVFLKTFTKKNNPVNYQVLLECCSRVNPSFVGYSLFKFYYQSYFPTSCPGYKRFDPKYELCQTF